MTNSQLIIASLQAMSLEEFSRQELFLPEDVQRMSPYITYAVRAGLLESVSHGKYRKTALLATSTPEELTEWIAQHAKLTSTGTRKPSSKATAKALPDTIEVDPLDILDQLTIEAIFDVLAAKFNTLAANTAPLKHDVEYLRDQVRLRESKINSLEVDISRLEQKLRVANAENNRLTALFSNGKQDRLVLTKPINVSGSVTFRDSEHKTVQIYRKNR